MAVMECNVYLRQIMHGVRQLHHDQNAYNPS